MKISILSVCISVISVAILSASADSPPKLGKEWTQDKEWPHHYKKTVQMSVSRAGETSNTQSYGLTLRNKDIITIDEADNKKEISISVNDVLKMQVQKIDQDKNDCVTFINNGKCVHHDINNDGIWDFRAITKPGPSRGDSIWLDEKWVRVEDSRDRPHEQRFSPGRKIQYTWVGEKWTSRATGK